MRMSPKLIDVEQEVGRLRKRIGKGIVLDERSSRFASIARVKPVFDAEAPAAATINYRP
jgi:hypothetical protein